MRVQSLLCRLGLVVASVIAVVGLPSGAAAQNSTGSVRGYVTDSSGNALEGARVVAVSVLTSAQREVTTQARGYYALLGLVPGEYEITARQIGMAPQLAFHAAGGAFSLSLPPRWRGALAPRAGRTVLLGIRPEDVRVTERADAGVRMRLDLVEPLGQELLVTARVGGHEVIARLPPNSTSSAGQDITLAFDPESLHFFDSETRERIA